MKKLFILTILGSLALSSCSDLDLDGAQAQQIKENAEELFGIIDPNQDWRCIDSGSIQVTADAPLNNITKIQILTESPFFNDQAKVLAEVNVSKGETKKLSFESPRGNDLLVAACVDDDGHYYVKGFSLQDTKVSFSSSAQTRTRSGFTRASVSTPDLSQIKMLAENSINSFNAERTIRANANANSGSISHWRNTGWENDRLWLASGSVGNGWYFNNGAIYRDVDPITPDEKDELTTIFKSCLYRDGSGTNKRDNLKLINEGSAVQLFDNHLISNGKAPISFIPVQLASTEAGMCDLYYYYFTESEVEASGMSKTEYIKHLPKFKAVDFATEKSVFTSSKKFDFEKHHEFILPYYGSPSDFEKVEKTLKHLNYKVQSGLYRIKNAEKGKCLTHSTKNNVDESMMDPFANDNARLPYQLWQLFLNEKDSTVLFYNIGSGTFLYSYNKDRPSFKEISEGNVSNCSFFFVDENDKKTTQQSNIRIAQLNPTDWTNKIVIKSDASIRIASEWKNKTIRATLTWTIEEYEPASSYADIMKTPSDIGLGTYTYEDPDITPSPIIPAGYNIGFMLRKVGSNYWNDMSGCMYSYGELNTETNQFGQFKNALRINNSNYSMEINSPRIGMFNANLKTYLCFEDGSDCNFSDIIIELGGFNINAIEKDFTGEISVKPEAVADPVISTSAVSGTYLFEDIPEDRTARMAYTMCFEDRPGSADYDLNDVVLRCVRSKTKTDEVQLSIIAVGATDNLYLEGIEGTLLDDETDLMSKEIHAFFRVEDETGEARFVNTMQGRGSDYSPKSSWYRIASDMSIPKFLSKIKVRNASTGQTIGVPEVGKPPYALILPGDFDYPREYMGIDKAYRTFQNWVQNAQMYNSWMDFIESEDYVIINQFSK